MIAVLGTAVTIGSSVSVAPIAHAVAGYTIGDPVVSCSSHSVALTFQVSTSQAVSLRFVSAQIIASGVGGGPAGPSDTHDFSASVNTNYSYVLGAAPDGPLKYQIYDVAAPSTVVKSGTVQIACGVTVDLVFATPSVDCGSGRVSLSAASIAGITYPGSVAVSVIAPDGLLVYGVGGGGDSSDLSLWAIDLNQRVVDGQVVPSPVVDGQYSYSLLFYTNWGQTLGVESAPFSVHCTPGSATAVAPWRIMDTRVTGGIFGAGAARSLQVTGVGGVPVSGVSSVVLNVTVTETTSGGYLTVSPTGSARPTVSNLNWGAGVTIPNAVTVKVGDGGKVDLFQSGPGTAQVIVDVAGYFMDGAVSAPGGYTAISPARLLDSRSSGGKMASGESRDLQITGAGGVPESNVSAVVLNATVTDTTSGGFLTLFPSGTAKPLASNLNWTAGKTIPNLVTVKVGDNGKVSLFQSGPGTAQVIVDVAGYYLGGTPTQPGMFVALAPSRVLDTRTTGKVAGGAAVTLSVLGKGGIPATRVSAVVVNTTVTDTTADGFLTVYPGTSALPTASNLNWVAGNTIPNLVTVQTGTDGSIKFHNGSGGTTQIIADTAGYYIS